MSEQELWDERALWWGAGRTREYREFLASIRRAASRELETLHPSDTAAIAERQARIRLLDQLVEGREAFLDWKAD